MVALGRVELGCHPLDYPGGTWTCPRTDITIPKGMTAEAIRRFCTYRRRVWERTDEDEGFRRAIAAACSASPLIWINTFGWTLRQQYVDRAGIYRTAPASAVPFMTWPVQDNAIEALAAGIEHGGSDIVIEKSRDMGATWLCLCVFAWFWLFRRDYRMICMARVEEDVDGGDDSLFFKFDALIARQPPWLIPSQRSKRLLRRNVDNGSSLLGLSTQKHSGRSKRGRALLVDEAAAIDELESILRATDSVVPCRIFNSTPYGPGAYSKLRFGGKAKVIILPFWDHPEKGRGREIETLPDGTRQWTCPFIRHEETTKSPREIAQNQRMDHAASGSLWFDVPVLNRHLAACRAPIYRGEMICTKAYGHDEDRAIIDQRLSEIRFEVGAGRKDLWIWCELFKQGRWRRPDQERDYILGVDIAAGTTASNSVIDVMDVDTGRVVAELASNVISPDRLARLAAMLGLWFGGRAGVGGVIHESNGGLGQIFTETMLRLGYPRLYRRRPVGKRDAAKKRTAEYGWNSDREAKKALMGFLRGELARDAVSTPSEMCLTECGQYVWYESGGIGPAPLENSTADEKDAHGDRAIAFGLCAWGRRFLERMAPAKIKAPPGSPAAEIEALLDDEPVDDEA